jgi:hypothetical protein
MDIHKNARLTPLARERLVNMVRMGKRRRPSLKPEAFALARCRNGSSTSTLKAFSEACERLFADEPAVPLDG